ncbi:MAG: 8-oxo-dGTP diphosphatase [Thermodesulfobacteriota bacterium]
MYTPIIATLGFILSSSRTKTLLVHRNARSNDQHFGKYNGLGGKMLAGESVLTCLQREIREEAGLICGPARLRGTINWPEFGKNGENWLGFIFVVDSFQGTPKEENNEGTLAWHPISSLDELPMWPGDRLFLPLVFDDDPRPFHGYMPYKDGQPHDWVYGR